MAFKEVESAGDTDWSGFTGGVGKKLQLGWDQDTKADEQGV